MKKIISTEHEKRVFILGCLLLFTFIVYRGIYLPIMNANDSIQDKIFILEKQLYKAKHALSDGKPFEQEYPQALNCFQQSLSDKQQLTTITTELKMLAQQSQLTLKADPPIKSKTSSLGNEFSIKLSVEGEFRNIFEFLYALQSCPHIYRTKELEILKIASSESRLECRLVLTKSLIK